MKSLTKVLLSCSTLALSLLICITLNAHAQQPDYISDILWVLDEDNEIEYQIHVHKSEEDRNGAAYMYVLDVPGIADPNQWGNYTSVRKAPDYLIMSDAFGVINQGPDYFLFFFSDTSTEECPYPLGPNTVYEHLLPNGRYGGMWNATMYLSPALQEEGWTAWFESGLTVPEPSTFVLWGCGAGVLALLKRRSTRS